ncbi:MAG: hypothetical protein AAF389_03110 [Gemmatimonadota bacterium]
MRYASLLRVAALGVLVTAAAACGDSYPEEEVMITGPDLSAIQSDVAVDAPVVLEDEAARTTVRKDRPEADAR